MYPEHGTVTGILGWGSDLFDAAQMEPVEISFGAADVAM